MNLVPHQQAVVEEILLDDVSINKSKGEENERENMKDKHHLLSSDFGKCCQCHGCIASFVFLC